MKAYVLIETAAGKTKNVKKSLAKVKSPRATVAAIGRTGEATEPPDAVRAGAIGAFRIWRSRAADSPEIE